MTHERSHVIFSRALELMPGGVNSPARAFGGVGGEPIVIDNVKVTDEHIKNRHLVLWGDPKSNVVLGKIAKSLPLFWTPQGVSIGQASGGSTCVPIMIYPNPLNGDKYVVLNSGFTFREDAFASNARQTPKLPDWAIVDAATPMTPRTRALCCRAAASVKASPNVTSVWPRGS